MLFVDTDVKRENLPAAGGILHLSYAAFDIVGFWASLLTKSRVG